MATMVMLVGWRKRGVEEEWVTTMFTGGNNGGALKV